MFRRFRSGSRRTRRDRSNRLSNQRSRKPGFESLEERRLLAVVVVSNNNDANNGDTSSIAALIASNGGDGISFREAILAANNTANVGGTPDEVQFNIAGAGVHTIQPTTSLPTISEAIFINGYTQAGAIANTTIAQTLNTTLTIEIDGQSAGGGASGLTIESGGGGSTIRGLAIFDFGTHGIFIDGSDGNVIAGNMIGLKASGAPGGNSVDGIRISGDSDNNTIGGLTAADRNMISRNDDDGIDLRDAEATNNQIIGNNIGTTLTNGLNAGNSGEGIVISGGSSNNTIGGAANAINFIGFNDSDGIAIEGGTSINNRISRNSMFINGDLGIDLNDDGVTGNDNGDGDSGPNRLQNFPEIIGTPTLVGNSIALKYRVRTAEANATYPLTVEFFSSESFAVSPNSAGRRFIAQDTYEAGDAEDVKTVVIPLTSSLFSTVIVATATDAAGNTSEFSQPIQLALPVILGSEPTVIRNDETIIADGINSYQYIAHSTGKLHVRIDFLHEFEGNLDLEVRDQFGNLLAPTASNSSADNDFEEIIIPVVTQQKYFIRVIAVDLEGEEMESYDLEVENFPAPVPSGIHLDPASDTGMMNNDNVTSDTTPTFFIQTDVLNFVDTNGNGTYQEPDTFPANTEDKLDALSPAEANALLPGAPDPEADDMDGGVSVEVTLTNTTDGVTVVTGFAEAVVGTLPDVYRFTPSAPLPAGVYLVTARTKVFDGQLNAVGAPNQKSGRSNASPPLWITVDATGAVAGMVSADLISSSDTGMLNNDNVTNKMQPAFNGMAPAGSKVRLYVIPNGQTAKQLVGQTVAGSDASDVGTGAIGGIGGGAADGLGLWEITVEPLDSNGYDLRLEIEDAAGNVTEVNPSFNAGLIPIPTDFVVDTVEPNTPYLDLLDDTGRSNADNITKDNTPMVSMTTSDPGIDFAKLLFADNLKFRIYDRFQNSANEVLIYDSAQDLAADMNTSLVGLEAMFTASTQLTKTMPFLLPVSPAITGTTLSDGIHNLKLEVEDRAGNISHDFLLSIIVDTTTPPVSFGLPDAASQVDGLTASSDSGVTTMPMTYADRITNDTTPTMWGRAEADTIVRLYLDRDNDGVIDLLTDTFLGLTTALPYDGNDAYPDGYWEITSALDLNEIVGLPKDGLRRLLVTAEDVAGNPMPMENMIAAGVDELQIFIDTQGPQITGVTVNDLNEAEYDLFDPKPSITGPTPLVNSLVVNVRDLPNRVAADFLYAALVEGIAETVGNYLLVGDHVGTVAIQSVVATFNPAVNGLPATASIELFFATPLPDDRYTFTISDNLVDPAGNNLDGESNADDPTDIPILPSGDGVPGGSFIGRFTIDSRPEIGSYVSQDIDVDINGNFVWDPANGQIGNDATNVDISWTLPVANADGSVGLGGFNVHDLLFAGKFRPLFIDGAGAGGGGPVVIPRYFDQLAAYGNSAQEGGIFRWIIDTNSDGVVTLGTDIRTVQPALANFNIAGAIPLAGNFDNNLDNGDEIGLYYSGKWGLDFNHNFVIEAGEVISTGLFGRPIVGDFDGDGLDDLAVFNTNVFSFNFRNDGFADANDATLVWGFPGVLDQPVAADMDQDGIDDIGLWVPRTSASIPAPLSEWYFLLSGDPTGNLRTTGTINRLNHAFTPVPFGRDLYAEFGDERAQPIVGNFDPPVAPRTNQAVVAVGDYNGDGSVNEVDYSVWKGTFGSTTNLAADGNGDGRVDLADYTVWRNHMSSSPAPAVQGGSASGDYNSSGQVTTADYSTWKSSFGSAANLSADGNGDGQINAADYTIWRNKLGTGSSGSGEGAGGSAGAESTAPIETIESPAFYEAASTAVFVAERAVSTVAVGSDVASDDSFLLLTVLNSASTSRDEALADFDRGASMDEESSTSLDELALAAAWQSWGEL